MARKILVVDDHAASVEAVRKALSAKGYEVEGYSDPEKALAAASAAVGLVLLDISMPGMDGITFAKRLKANPETAKVPVVFLTAVDPREKHWEALKAGGKAYLRKPVKLSALLEVVVDQMGLSDKEAADLLKELNITREPPARPKQDPPGD